MTPVDAAWEALRTDVTRLAHLTPDDWASRRGADRIARTINAARDLIFEHRPLIEAAIRAEAGTLDWLTLAFRKAELDWPERPELAYAGLRTAIRARLAEAEHGTR